MNALYLRRQRKVYVKDDGAELSLPHLATLQKNVESLGFIFSPTLLERIKTSHQPRRRSTAPS